MSTTSAIVQNKSTLKFRTPIPPVTGRVKMYPYENQLNIFSYLYLKKYHNGSENTRKQILHFYEVYEDGFLYLEASVSVFNKKGWTKIIDVSTFGNVYKKKYKQREDLK